MLSQITPAQIRGARGFLDWSMAQLADAARLSVSTIKRMEMTTPQPISEGAYGIVRSTFEEAGIRFLDDDGHGCGIRLRNR